MWVEESVGRRECGGTSLIDLMRWFLIFVLVSAVVIGTREGRERVKGQEEGSVAVHVWLF